MHVSVADAAFTSDGSVGFSTPEIGWLVCFGCIQSRLD